MKYQKKIEEIIAFVLFLFLSINHAQAQYVESEYCLGGPSNDVVYDVQPTPDSGLLALIQNGTNSPISFGNFIGLIKFNSNLQIEWQKTLLDSVAALPWLDQHDGNYYVSYLSISPVYSDTAIYATHIFKINSAGQIIWSKSYTSGHDYVGNIYNYVQNQRLYFLNNNTLLFSSNMDSSVTFYNLNDSDGAEKWNLTYDYSDDIANVYSDGGTYIKTKILETKENNLLLTSHPATSCWFACGEPPVADYTLVDYNGNVIQHISSDFNYGKLADAWYEDDQFIYAVNQNYNVYSINKNTLDINSIDTIPGTQCTVYNEAGNIKKQNYPYYVSTNLEYYNNTPTQITYLQKYDLDKQEMIYKIPLFDSSSVANILRFYSLNDKHDLVLYNIDTAYHIMYLDSTGNIIYDKRYYPQHNPDGITHMEWLSYNFLLNSPSYSYIHHGKLFYYAPTTFYDGLSNPQSNQNIFIYDIANGQMEFQYVNELKDTLIYKYIQMYPGTNDHLFMIGDLNGIHKCNLGGLDIQVSDLLLYANNVNGRAFIDYNNNHIKDSSDVYFSQGYLESTKDSKNISTYLSANSYVRNYVDTGAWTNEVKTISPYFTATPVSVVTQHNDYGNSDSLLFSLYPNSIVQDLKLTLVNPFITRLGQPASYEITYANAGTHPASGSVKVILDPRLSFTGSIPNISSQNGDTLIWDFNNLAANANKKITIQFNTSIPPTLNTGDTLHSLAIVTPVIGDTIPEDNFASLDEIIRTSYDPNDKTTTSGKDITHQQIDNDEYITYVVRFQNTGNDTAFRVVIEDTLDAKLDWSSLQPVGASHPFTMQVVNDHILEFTFDKIKLLPSSFDETKSHGYVAYKIKVKKDAAAGYTIKNTAHIYFDLNPPVATQTVQTRILTLTATSQHAVLSGTLQIYPNPNNGQFTVRLKDNSIIQNLQLIDITGKTVYEEKTNSREAMLQVINLPKGMYAIRINAGEKIITEKIIIE